MTDPIYTTFDATEYESLLKTLWKIETLHKSAKSNLSARLIMRKLRVFNPIPGDNILHMSKLKVFADDKSNVA